MWEILIAVIVIFYFFTLPISLCFWSKIEDIEKNFVFYRSYQLIHSVVIFVLLMDCVLYFFVGYYEKGILTNDLGKIQPNYLRGLFPLNLMLIFVPLNQVYHLTGDFQAINLLFYLKLINLMRLNSKILRMIQLYRTVKLVFKMASLIMFIIFIANLMACIYWSFSLAIMKATGMQTWLVNNVTNVNLIE